MPLFTVIVIPMLKDNFCYYVHRKDNVRQGFFVDVGSELRLLDFLDDFGMRTHEHEITHVLTTHKHFDHCGGNEELSMMFKKLQII